MELIAQSTLICNASRPMHDQRYVHSALMRVLLVVLERSVTGLRPTPRVVRVAMWTTDVVDAPNCFLGSLEQEVEELHLMHNSEGAALLACTVVG